MDDFHSKTSFRGSWWCPSPPLGLAFGSRKDRRAGSLGTRHYTADKEDTPKRGLQAATPVLRSVGRRRECGQTLGDTALGSVGDEAGLGSITVQLFGATRVTEAVNSWWESSRQLLSFISVFILWRLNLNSKAFHC